LYWHFGRHDDDPNKVGFEISVHGPDLIPAVTYNTRLVVYRICHLAGCYLCRFREKWSQLLSVDVNWHSVRGGLKHFHASRGP